MKSNIFLYGVIAVVVIIGGVLLINKDDAIVSEDQNIVENSPEEASRFSMRELVERNEPVRCTFVHNTEVGESSGEVFVADGKVRGNFDISAKIGDGQTFKAYMIADGEFSYVWSSVIPQGFKSPISRIEDSSTQPADGIDYNTELDYSCSSWSVDASVFVPPASVSFVDMPQDR